MAAIWIIIVIAIILGQVKKSQKGTQQNDRRPKQSSPNVPRQNYQRTQPGYPNAPRQNYQRTQPGYPNAPRQNYQRTQPGYPNAPRQQSSPRVPQQNYRPGHSNAGQAQPANPAAAAKQRELKDRLTQRYGKPGGTAGGQAGKRQNTLQQPGDILSRANANVRENEQDLLEQDMSVRHPGGPMVKDAHDLIGMVDIREAGELMREVSDLMLMGYQADMTYERDFVAEGVEMLNRYELPVGE